MNFRVGQKLECINDNGYLVTPTIRPHPKKGEVITFGGYGDMGAVYIAECGVGFEYPCFFPSRFRPLVEKKTDTGMAVLNKIRIEASVSSKENA